MRKQYILMLSVAAIIFATDDALAQAYELKVLSGQAYKEIDSADYEVPDSSVYFNDIRTNPEIKLSCFGKPYDLAQSGVIIPILQGYCYYANSSRSTTLYAAKGAFAERPGTNEVSMFSFKKEGSVTNAIYVMQWKNMGFQAGDAGDYINFQVKLYEATGVIEYCFGPSASKSGLWENGANGPTIGLLEMDDAFNTIYNQIWLSGNAFSPVMVGTNAIVNLNDVPQNGVVYRFTPKPTNIGALPGDKPTFLPTVHKAGSRISIDCDENTVFVLIDMTGRKVAEMRVSGGSLQWPEVPHGNYVLRNIAEGRATGILITD